MNSLQLGTLKKYQIFHSDTAEPDPLSSTSLGILHPFHGHIRECARARGRRDDRIQPLRSDYIHWLDLRFL